MDRINWVIIRKTLKILWLTTVAVASFLFAGALVIQLPQVQTAIAGRLMEALSQNLDGDISIEKLHLKPFTTLILKNTVITDKTPARDTDDTELPQIDTFFRAEYIIAKFSLEGLLHSESIRIDMAYVGNAQMNLTLEDLILEDGSVKAYNNLSRIFRIKDSDRKEPPEKEIFRIRDIEISDMGFHMVNRSSRKTPYYGGINWNNLDIKDINISANGLRFENGIMYGEAESISFKEKTGFTCHEMSGKAKVGRGRTIVEDLNIRDEWSDIDIPLFMMSYSNILDFNDFIHKVQLDAELASSIVDFRTITHFAPQLDGNRLKATASGVMSGCIDDFTVRNFHINSLAGGFSGIVNGRITGIPDTYDMWINARVNDMTLTADGLGRFITEWMPEGELDLSRFGKGMVFKADARARGYLNNLDVSATLKSPDGNLQANAKLDDLLKPDRAIRIGGTICTDRLDLGRVADTDILGPASFSSRLSMEVGKELSVEMDSLRITQLVANGYNYRDILARGNYDSSSLNGTIISKDPNLNFIFQGGYARSDKSQNTVYKYNASIGNADLHKINLDKRGKSIIQLRTSGNFTRTGTGDIFGRIDAGEILVENKTGRYDIGDIVVTSHSVGDKFQARLNSKFAEGIYTGTGSLTDFMNDLKGITVLKEMPALSEDSSYKWSGNTYNLDFVCHDVHNLLAFAVPGLYIENGTSLEAGINAEGSLAARLQSNRIAFKRNYMKGLDFTLDNHGEAINGKLTCNEISAASIKMNDNILLIHANDNYFGAGFSFDNHSDPETNGELIINGNISREEESPALDIDIRPSSIQYNGKEWSIQSSKLRVHDGDIDIDSFGVVSGEQAAGIFGKISDDSQETISLNLERFDISILNALMPKNFGIRGTVTGTAEFKSPVDDMELMVDMICDSSYVANVPLGVVSAGTTWNEEQKQFDVYVWNELSGARNINLNGSIAPATKRISAEMNLDKLNIGYVQPLLTDIFSQMEGHISGNVNIDGPLDRIALRCNEGKLENAMLKIAYTGVPYQADGPFHADENGIWFDGITIKDRFDGTGIVTGSINHDHFKDISFDTRIKVNRIEAINIAEKDADAFYGNIYGTGDITITGPVNSIMMDINAMTEKPGQLHIPVSSSLTSSKGTNLLKFKELDKSEFIDPYETFMLRTANEDVSTSDFLVRLKVNARPDVEAFVEIDKASGNILSGRGTGNISLEAGEDIFNINGDYTINSGNYKFVAMGLVGRDFKIQDGSSIRFNGDIMESTLDINAIYRTKASLSTLISDTTSVANRRTVECGIGIKDQLMNPQLSFSIEIPDLDPTIKSRVESALSTEDKVQKQFLSLIISNNFLPDEQSGIVNNTSVLYSNVSEMMANQINNIFQKLDIPLDLGLNYQPNERGNDIFDVAVSTQLFNNRVVVNGNIGNRQYSSGNSQNEVAGDIDIEIKLDRSGAFRLNLFSHSADQYTNYLDNSQRNGVGVTYQTEFNTFRQFFKSLFSSKQKRLETRQAEEQAALDEQRIQIMIEPQQK